MHTAGKSKGSVRTQLEGLYNSASLNITVYQETTPPSRVTQQLGLWDAGNNYIAAARAVTNLPSSYRYNFTNMAQWNYMIDNTPTLVQAYLFALDLQASLALLFDFHGQQTTKISAQVCGSTSHSTTISDLMCLHYQTLLVQTSYRAHSYKHLRLCMLQTAAAQDSAKTLRLVDIILLAVEGGCLIPLAFLYLYWVRRAVAKDRASLYSTFLRVPRPTVVAIAKAEVKLVGEDGDDDDDEPGVCINCLVLQAKCSLVSY